jgi:hypothetical protein
MMAIGVMIRKMAKEFKLFQMETSMKEILLITSLMVGEF